MPTYSRSTSHPSSSTPGTNERTPASRAGRCWGAAGQRPLCHLHLGRLLLRDKVPRMSAKSSGSAPPCLSPTPEPGTRRVTASLLEPLIISLLCAKQLLSRNSGSPMIVKTADKKIISRALHFKKLIEGHKGKFHTSEVLAKAERGLKTQGF